MSRDILDGLIDWADRSLVHTSADHEAEVLYYVLSAFNHIRPSIVLQIARQVSGPDHFLEVVKLALMAVSDTDRAELFAGDACDTFEPHQANRADNTYCLILSAVCDTLDPDPEWISARDTTRRVQGWIEEGKKP